MCIRAWMYPILASWFNVYDNAKTNTIVFMEKFSIALTSIFTPERYVFYTGYNNPVLFTKAYTAGSARPYIVYDVEHTAFFPYDFVFSSYESVCRDTTIKYLPILSLEIVDANDNVLYDLTDFVINIRYAVMENRTTPTFSNIAMIWSNMKHIYPDKNETMFRYINMDGETMKVAIDSISSI